MVLLLGFNESLPGKGISLSTKSLQMDNHPILSFPRKTLVVGKVYILGQIHPPIPDEIHPPVPD